MAQCRLWSEGSSLYWGLRYEGRAVAALTKAFGAAPAGGCALASVKSQIGHLGAAAGVVGLIRASLAVFHGVVPPNLGFGRINPQIDLEHSPFYVPTTSRPWPEGRRRLAGVSSFGIGR